MKNLWAQERLTIEQVFGQIIRHLELNYEEIKQLRRDLILLKTSCGRCLTAEVRPIHIQTD